MNTKPKPAIAIIAALDEQTGLIGEGGRLLWNFPEDMKRFRELTMHNPVIVGRKTWESIPGGKLPGRKLIVVSRTLKRVPAGIVLVSDIDRALKSAYYYAEARQREKIFVAGGGEIYRQFIPLASTLYLTLVRGNYGRMMKGDTFFPYWRGFGDVTEERRLEYPGPAGFTARFVTIKKFK